MDEMKKYSQRLGMVVATLCLVFYIGSAMAQTNNKAVTDNWQIGIQTWTFRMFTLQEALEKAIVPALKV